MDYQKKCGECEKFFTCRAETVLDDVNNAACGNFERVECALCGSEEDVFLEVVKQDMIFQGKQITIDRWLHRCRKCGRASEPGWMFNRNLAEIRKEVAK